MIKNRERNSLSYIAYNSIDRISGPELFIQFLLSTISTHISDFFDIGYGRIPVRFPAKRAACRVTHLLGHVIVYLW